MAIAILSVVMSLTRHEEIGRVGRVGRGCYEETVFVEFKLYTQEH